MNETRQLAIDGGEPAFPAGPPAWPVFDEDVVDVLSRVANDGSWGRYHAEHCEQLRQALSELHGLDHVLLVSSGTIAVELALRGLDIGKGDEVIVAAYDFPGNFRAIESVGATPVLADIDANTWCVDANQFDQAITLSTRAVIVSHLHGGLADMPAISRIARDRNIAIVEDACQSPGATVHGRMAGTWGDVGVLSFGGSKLLTAGRGGAVLTSDASALQRMKVYANRGNDAFALSELQAAVLLPQLAKLAKRNEHRRASVTRLVAQLANVEPLRGVINTEAGSQPAHYKVAWCYQPAIATPDRRTQIIAAMAAEGIAIDSGFRGFAGRSERRCRKHGTLENAVAAADATLLLHHPVLLEEQATIDALADAIRDVVLRDASELS